MARFWLDKSSSSVRTKSDSLAGPRVDQSAMSRSEDELRALQAQIKEGISKIDAQMKPKPLWQRIRAHVAQNSNHMIIVTLAGSLMVVAYGRLSISKQLQVRLLQHAFTLSSGSAGYKNYMQQVAAGRNPDCL